METNGIHGNGNGITVESLIGENSHGSTSNHGWQKVTYPKRNRKQAREVNSVDLDKTKPNGDDKSKIFLPLEQHAEERRKRREDQAAAANAVSVAEFNGKTTASDDDSEGEISHRNGAANGAVNGEEKKPKQKKPKKPKVTVVDAAAKIDASNLADFLAEISASFEKAPDVQLMRFADYFARAFSAVTYAQFPLNKILKESTVAKLGEIPLCYIPEAVQKTSADWINQQPIEALSEFALWAFSSMLEDVGTQQQGHKGSKQVTQQASSKTKVAIFVVLALVLRRRPEILQQLSPTFKTGSQFQGQDKLSLIVWAVAQVCQGDMIVGMSLWVQNLLPMAIGKSSTPLSRHLSLQLVESILLANQKKARPILLNGATRKGERLVPPSALNLLMQAAFPLDSARTKATERFQAIYPFLKELALSGPQKSKATKTVAQQLLPLSLSVICKENKMLSEEATGVFIWCLSQNTDCYKQWEKLHLEYIEASTMVLEKTCLEWKNNVTSLSHEHLRETLKSIKLKHEHALENRTGDARLQVSVKEADKYCKIILGKVSHRNRWFKVALVILLLAIAVRLAAKVLESWELKNLMNV